MASLLDCRQKKADQDSYLLWAALFDLEGKFLAVLGADVHRARLCERSHKKVLGFDGAAIGRDFYNYFAVFRGSAWDRGRTRGSGSAFGSGLGELLDDLRCKAHTHGVAPRSELPYDGLAGFVGGSGDRGGERAASDDN